MATEMITDKEMARRIDELPPEDPNMKETFFMDYIKHGYIIYDGKKNKAVCTRCGQEWDLYPGEYAGLHGLKDICPYCESENILLAAGRGRKDKTEYHRLLSFSEHKGTLWAFLNSIIVDFSPQGRPALYNSMDEVYIINREEQSRYHRNFSYYYGSSWYFSRINNMKIPEAPHGMGYWCGTKWQDHAYTEGLKEMIERSDCKYFINTIPDVEDCAMVLPTHLGTMMKYHSVELLAKAGFTNIANWKINGNGCRAVNWRANSLEKILKLPTGDIKRLRSWDPSTHELELFQMLPEKLRREIDIMVIQDMISHYEYDYKRRRYKNNYKKKVEKYMPLDKWNRWAKTQDSYREHKHSPHLLKDYIDYINAAEKLGMDIHKKSVLRPKDLKQAHDNAVEQLRIETNAAIDKLIAENCRTDDFKSGSLMIIPAVCQEDLNKESANLHHCVRIYGDKLAKGKCYIFFVRDIKRPQEPYYTLETKPDGTFVQCRGLHNCSMTDEVDIFTKAFVKKLKAEIKKERKAACQTA